MSSKITQKELSIVKTGLFMIANAMIVHEALVAIGALKGINPLAKIDTDDPRGWLIKEWESILKTNYKSVFEPALKLLKTLPSHPSLKKILLDLAKVAQKAVENRAILRHDLAGRLYHTLLLRDIAKGLATYYTSIPAATLLASLALDLLAINWGSIEEVAKVRIADFACGSGTLLSAVYNEIVDRHIMGTMRPNLSQLHKVLVEKVLYGFDVLEYAVHLTAASLVLRDPTQPVGGTNTFVLPLGVYNGEVHLGSLDIRVIDDYITFPMQKTLFGTISAQAVRVDVDASERPIPKIERPHLVIMNPPFARTGNVGKSTLFGHLPEADRKEVLNKLKELGKKMTDTLKLSGSFGRAGLAAYFLLKAYEVSRPDAVLAFVLPRVFLSGSDWRSVREFMAKSGHFEYIIISDDPEALWAWSENTDLSEILMVYKKCRNCGNGDVTVVYVRKRPSSALEAKVYASLIRTIAGQLEIRQHSALSPTKIVRMDGNEVMYIYKVRESAVREVASVNMNIIMGFHSSHLSEIAYNLYAKKKFLRLDLPLIPLSKYLVQSGKCRTKWENCVGYDVAQTRRRCIKNGKNPVLFLAEVNMNTFSSPKLPSSALRTTYVPDECLKRAGRLLVPGVGRFRLTTIGVVAAYYDQPVLSQAAWTIPLSDEEAKIQALWLNTTPGLIHLLSMRQDSAGGFVQLKKKSLGDLLLIDVPKLSVDIKSKLLNLFDEYANTPMGRILSQLKRASNRQGPRYEIDVEFLELFGANEQDIERLLGIYRDLQNETLFGESD